MIMNHLNMPEGLELRSQESDSASMAPPTASRKRQKVSIACMPCRRKKMKCDAVRPTCGACMRSIESIMCLYPGGRGDGKLEVDQANKTSSEPIVQANVPDSATPINTRAAIGPPDDPSSRDSFDIDTGSVLPPSIIPTAIGSTVAASENSTKQIPEACNVDSMNGVTGVPSQTSEIFGSSSAGSFMRHVQAAINAKQGMPSIQDQTNTTTGTTDGPEFSNHEFIPRHEQAALFVLPPRPLADRLMHAYWEFEWSLFPVVDRPNLESVYQNLWSCSEYDCPTVSMSMINICLALGCQYCDFIPTTDRASMGKDFFKRADQLYQRSGRSPRLEKVTLLLLQSIYLQSTPDAFRCWMTGGEAIRMAQSLGLYSEQHSSHESVRHREHKRRVWHGCIWLDRVLSATLGRPGMIPQWLFGSTPLPLMIDDEFLDTQTVGSSIRPDRKPSVMAFAVKAFELYQILDSVLLEMYLTSTREEKFDDKLDRLLEIDKKLLKWKKYLPIHLQSRTTTNEDSILDRQATVLKIRFLHVRILLLRPALVLYTKRGFSKDPAEPNFIEDTSVSGIVVLECSRLCLRLAQEMIDIFEKKLDRTTKAGPLPSWWYSVLYIYTAATTIRDDDSRGAFSCCA